MQVNGQTTADSSHVIVPPVRSKKKLIPPPMDLSIVKTMDESIKMIQQCRDGMYEFVLYVKYL